MTACYRSALPTWDITGSRVILRADLNVPLSHHTPLDNDIRLHGIKPTLDYILSKRARIILITHIGRPTHPTPELSTQQLLPWFISQGYDIAFAPTPAYAQHLSAPIILLENSRFFPGEKKHDPLFAQELAQLGDYYVNDAFGAMHRTDCSIIELPLLFAPERRTFGFLVEKELRELTSLQQHPKKPFLMIIGGAKVAEKIPLIAHMLNIVDTIALCPAIVFTFNKVKGMPVGNSLVDDQSISLSSHIMHKAHTKNVSILFPSDYQIATGSITGPLSYTPGTSLNDNEVGISIGPRTVESWSHIIEQAGTIFCNGLPGFSERSETLHSTRILLHKIATAPGKSVIAGGDSVAMVMQEGLASSIDYLSTGGGSAIEFLAEHTLPGLQIFINNS